ncbi:MAG: hypothetical protein ISQ85_06340, partial [Planktomarina sp.]|nr:hypothetical protein [Planktomarina sp.]
MCGFVGYVGSSNSVSQSLTELTNWSKSLNYRGPDGYGSLIVNQKNFSTDINHVKRIREHSFSNTIPFAFGQRRLAINDLDAGDQPLFSADYSMVLIHNGEIYNYNELKALLTKKGHRFSTKSDSEVIIHAYEEWGIEGISKLDGPYAFALADLKKGHFVLARDPFGEKPLFIAEDQSGFSFASEAKALFPIIKKAKISSEAILSYFSFGHVLPPFGWQSNIRKLSPGEVSVYNGQSWSCSYTNYWDKIPLIPTSISKEDALLKIDEKLDQILNNCSLSDDSIAKALLLSGGIDSSLIAYYLKENNISFNAYTLVDPNIGADSEDFKRAQNVADFFGCNHQILDFEQKDVNLLHGERIGHLDEPTSNLKEIHIRYNSYAPISTKAKVAFHGGFADSAFLNGAIHYGASNNDVNFANNNL